MDHRNARRTGPIAVIAASSLAFAVLPATGSVAAIGPTVLPTAGSAGLGDRLYPTLGNGGYNALHYDLNLRYPTSRPSGGVIGTMIMRARATQALSRFNLDFAGGSVGDVTVNGVAARFTNRSRELVITPAVPIQAGAQFSVQVRHFTAKPTRPGRTDASAAFFVAKDGSATAGQPEVMHYLFPSNDHPSDKATFSFELNVVKGQTAVANGVLTSKRTTGRRTIWRYQQRQPMATELTQVAVGALSVIDRGKVNGVPVRDVVPTRLLSTYKKLLATEKNHLRWMEARVGPYPFDSYGSLIVDAPLGTALETQTLSVFDSTYFTGPDSPIGSWSPLMLHELAHQWFGNSVSPATWSDIWLNEGHASWYEFTFAAQMGFLKDDAEDYGEADFVDLMKDVYADSAQLRAEAGPIARPVDADHVFSENVYLGGALALYALQQKIGVRAFQKVERAWVQVYRGRSASTDNFIELASTVSGQDLSPFLRSWLYGKRTPPMPGHPDWVVDPTK